LAFFVSLRFCDLFESTGEPLDVDDGRVAVAIEPRRVKVVRLHVNV
jgi:hypothetical protein